MNVFSLRLLKCGEKIILVGIVSFLYDQNHFFFGRVTGCVACSQSYFAYVCICVCVRDGKN